MKKLYRFYTLCLLPLLCGSLFCVQKSPRSVPGEKAIPGNRQIFRNYVPAFARYAETFRQSLAHLPIDNAPQQGKR